MFEAMFDVSLWQFGFKETELFSPMTAAASKCGGCKLLKLRMLSVWAGWFGRVAQIGVNRASFGSVFLSCLFSLPYGGDTSGRPLRPFAGRPLRLGALGSAGRPRLLGEGRRREPRPVPEGHGSGDRADSRHDVLR